MSNPYISNGRGLAKIFLIIASKNKSSKTKTNTVKKAAGRVFLKKRNITAETIHRNALFPAREI